MTGPEHYTAAEEHLRAATAPHIEHNDMMKQVALAHAHAMLALAAATATEPARMPVARQSWRDWADAVLPQVEWSCEICGKTARTAPGGEPPDLGVCRSCAHDPEISLLWSSGSGQ